MIWNLAICVLLVLNLGLLLFYGRMHFRTPACGGNCTCLTVALSADGDAPELEACLKDLLWLREGGYLCAEVYVLDRGLDAEAAALAQTFCRQHAHLHYMREGDATPWKNSGNRQN